MYFAWAENVDPLAASLRPSSGSFAAWLSMTSAAPHGTAVVGMPDGLDSAYSRSGRRTSVGRYRGGLSCRRLKGGKTLVGEETGAERLPGTLVGRCVCEATIGGDWPSSGSGDVSSAAARAPTASITVSR